MGKTNMNIAIHYVGREIIYGNIITNILYFTYFGILNLTLKKENDLVKYNSLHNNMKRIQFYNTVVIKELVHHLKNLQ